MNSCPEEKVKRGQCEWRKGCGECDCVTYDRLIEFERANGRRGSELGGRKWEEHQSGRKWSNKVVEDEKSIPVCGRDRDTASWPTEYRGT